MVSRLVVQDVKLHKLERHREDTEPCRVRIETAMRGDKDGGEARVARAEIARAVASGSSMEIEPPLAAPMEPPPPPSSSSAMFGAETPRAGLMPGAETPGIGASASSSRKRTAAEGGDETVTAMADDRGNPFQAVEMLELCAVHELATGVLCSVNFGDVLQSSLFLEISSYIPTVIRACL